MHILMTGGTGLIGRALVDTGLQQGHQFTLWVRNRATAERRFGQTVALVDTALALDALERVDWVINLAGEPVACGRWSENRKRQLLDSRLHITRMLADWINRQDNHALVFLSGSATGFYGDCGAVAVDEHTAPATQSDFASHLCYQWEAEAACARKCRNILLRTGLVLSCEGGLLARLLPPFRMGLGGRLGSGRQFMPWIHIDDYVRAVFHLAAQPNSSGPFNICAPHPATNAEFTRQLAQRLARPAWLHLPTPLVKLLFGELSNLMLSGQNAQPAKLIQASFAFQYPKLDQALGVLL